MMLLTAGVLATTAQAEIIDQTVVEGYTAVVSANLPPGFAHIAADPSTTSFAYQGDPTCSFGFGKVRTDAQIFSIGLRDQVLNSFRQIQAAGFALSNPAEPQFINHGTSMYMSYATIMSNGSTLIKAAAQGANGGRIIAAFNCPRGGPQMANTAFMALQTLDVQLQRAAGTKPYYDQGENMRRMMELNSTFNRTH